MKLGKTGQAELKRLKKLMGNRADPKVIELAASVYEEMQIAKEELEDEGRFVYIHKGEEMQKQNAPAYKRWFDCQKTYRQLISDLQLLSPKAAEPARREFI